MTALHSPLIIQHARRRFSLNVTLRFHQRHQHTENLRCTHKCEQLEKNIAQSQTEIFPRLCRSEARMMRRDVSVECCKQVGIGRTRQGGRLIGSSVRSCASTPYRLVTVRLTMIKYQASFPSSFGTKIFTFWQRPDHSCSLCCILSCWVDSERRECSDTIVRFDAVATIFDCETNCER
jgi:hypothetical protein